jgi:hypothetical protein
LVKDYKTTKELLPVIAKYLLGEELFALCKDDHCLNSKGDDDLAFMAIDYLAKAEPAEQKIRRGLLKGCASQKELAIAQTKALLGEELAAEVEKLPWNGITYRLIVIDFINAGELQAMREARASLFVGRDGNMVVPLILAQTILGDQAIAKLKASKCFGDYETSIEALLFIDGAFSDEEKLCRFSLIKNCQNSEQIIPRIKAHAILGGDFLKAIQKAPCFNNGIDTALMACGTIASFLPKLSEASEHAKHLGFCLVFDCVSLADVVQRLITIKSPEPAKEVVRSNCSTCFGSDKSEFISGLLSLLPNVMPGLLDEVYTYKQAQQACR